ncbi:DNA-binding transcriptional regulator, MerR family [Seinonella peptonophila]|uniref:DNA-binding transcriptional regulator, MerR family n=1 Tax=Seinonella peptonophila TaxID=112248 RepID=A0A1M4Y5S7_9BACL|nr:MerR family transcriptional regulator [Seinonella peptonophila]SHF00976.1 DNA-binding transcriptional regulator, MerR family [Seinonella peptonophila]
MLKIGELANMTGITVRTLHYYDEVGLLKPSKITETGHRLYDMQNITTLYQIMSLKDMGFNLDEINDLIHDRYIDIQKFIEVQISKVQEEIVQKQLLFSRLLKLKQELKGNQNISIDDFKAIVPFINASADKYITKEQLDKIKNNLEGYKVESEEATEWIEFIAKLNYCYDNKLHNTDLIAIECINYWRKLMNKSIGEDEKLKDSIFSFHASLDNSQLRYGLTDDLYKYLMELMK